MDNIGKAHRSWNMSRIKGRDTAPERTVRFILHKLGLRFRLHRKDLPGKPDIVLPKYKTVIFVNGCYWHRHKGCKNCTTPATNTAFWTKKFEDTVKRDIKNTTLLKQKGWGVQIIWECQIKKDPLEAVLTALLDGFILSQEDVLEKLLNL